MRRKSKAEIQKSREDFFAQKRLSAKSDENVQKDKTNFFLFTQGIYFISCLLEAIFCCIYQNMDKAVSSDMLLFMMVLLMYPISFGIIVLPASFIHNIKIAILKYKQKSPRRIFWFIWTLLSPILHLVIFGLGGGLFVAATGGV